MNRCVRSFLFVSSLIAFSKLAADTVDTADTLSDNEVRSIREWISTKRQVTVKEIGGNMSISGEVSTEFRAFNERVKGIRQRLPGGVTDEPSLDFEVGFKLIIDYRTDRTWSNATLKFKNKAGQFGGTTNKIKLEKAYWGARMIQEGATTFDIEVGRKPLYSIFDSKIQFDSFCDGAVLNFTHSFEKLGTFYVEPGVFLIDARKDHFGWVGEIGVLEIMGTGFYTKYSLIDWDTKHQYDPIVQRKFQFINSQFICGYQFVSKSWDKKINFYSAWLYNHRAKPRAITDWKRAAWGGYAGFSIGTARKQGDWAFDANYQVVSAQAIPQFDVFGIGIGNAADAGFYYNDVKGVPVPTTRATARGNTNWRGFDISLVYLITNALAIKQEYCQSMTINSAIGHFRRYKKYELKFVYAF